MLIEGLVPALKRGKDGKVFVGKKGQMHFHVFNDHKEELKGDTFEGGFYDEDTHEYLTRKEALAKHGFEKSEHSPEFLKAHNTNRAKIDALRKKMNVFKESSSDQGKET